jgi:hypothetical protein
MAICYYEERTYHDYFGYVSRRFIKNQILGTTRQLGPHSRTSQTHEMIFAQERMGRVRLPSVSNAVFHCSIGTTHRLRIIEDLRQKMCQ